MSFEQRLIIELIGMVKWIAVGCLLITFTMHLINRVVDRKARNAARLMSLAQRLLNEQSTKFVDYLIKEIEGKKPQE